MATKQSTKKSKLEKGSIKSMLDEQNLVNAKIEAEKVAAKPKAE